MYPRNRSIILAFSLILVLAVSAMAVQPALADDSTPPPPAPSTGSVSSSPTGNNLSAKAPAGTDVVVLDRSGNSVPLASQKAAQIVAAGDPIWCPKGVAPRPGVGGCSPAINDTKFGTNASGDLLNWLISNDPLKKLKAGAIWIEGNYVSGSVEPLNTSFTLNGSTLTNMSNYSLDINGGWNGTAGSKTIDKTHPSEFDASLSIINWHAPITLSDIKVTGVMANPYEAYALSIQTDKGGITLNRVQVIDNYNVPVHFAAGAHLDTHLATVGHLVPVTVNDSVFSNNFGTGLFIESSGAVKIRNLTADYNGGSIMGIGTIIINGGSNSNQPVTLTGTNEFKGNFGDGLLIQSTGAVTLNNITADNNNDLGGNGVGVLIYNISDSSPSVVKLTGTNWFTHNAQDGLTIYSNGNISLNNINAIYNSGDGTELDNCFDSGVNTPCTTAGKTVTLTGLNSFNGNTAGSGLYVLSSGAIKISQITASYNGGMGADLENCDFNSSGICLTPLPYNVTLTNASTFEYNSSTGLYISATGTVSLKNIIANVNGGYGAGIVNNAHLLMARPVIISGNNEFTGNTGNGLEIDSYGAITLSNITADDNTGGYGACLDNMGYDSNAGGPGVFGSAVITRMPVTLTGINTFNNNYYDGLWVYSIGAISVSNITASNNGTVSGDSGVYLENNDNWYPNGYFKPYAANVTLSGFGTFENNGRDGIDISSFGAVKLTNLTTDYNSNNGAEVLTNGSVTMSHINADLNGSDGIYVNATQNVTITCGSTFHNSSDGFYLWSGTTTTGATITLIGVQSSYNGSGTNEILLPVGVVVHRTASCP